MAEKGKSFSDSTLTILGLMAAIAALVVGLGIFYSRYTYAEPGTGNLVLIYTITCIAIFFAIRLWSTALIAICIIVAGATQFYASQKFDWREDYVRQAQAGQPFFLEEFTDHYPTFEEYTFSFLDAPDWVRFNDQCVQPALLNQPVLPRCASFDLIQRYYNIDMQATMQDYFNRMKHTAKMVEGGQLTKRSAYAECLADKSCATIPLLPKGVQAAQIDTSSQDYIGVRQAFWSLVNDRTMSSEVCALTPLCRALVGMKAVESGKLPF